MNAWHRFALLLVPATPLVLMLSAWLFYHHVYVRSGGVYMGDTHNRGTLIVPPILLPERLLAKPGSSGSYQNKRWVLLILGADNCEQSCKETLYQTRQAHIALGRHAWRVQRVYWSPSPLSDGLRAFLGEQHPGMVISTTAAMSAAIERLPEGSYYLLDPDNFAMMAYSAEHGGADVLDDLRFLLKISV